MSPNLSPADGDAPTTHGVSSRAVRRGRVPRWGRVVAAAALSVGLAACTSAPGPGEPAASPSAAPTAASGSSSSSPAADALTVDITIAGDTVTPNGQKIDVAVGREVVLQVTSDIADEIHAHTGGDGYELEVTPGQTTTGTFTLDTAGSFEVESHHSGKVIVILNAR